MWKKDKHQTPTFLPPFPSHFTLLLPDPLPTWSRTGMVREQYGWNTAVSPLCYPALVQALPIGWVSSGEKSAPMWGLRGCNLLREISNCSCVQSPTGCSERLLHVPFQGNIISSSLLHRVKGRMPSLRDFTTGCSSHSLFSEIDIHRIVSCFCVPSSSVCVASSDLS